MPGRIGVRDLGRRRLEALPSAANAEAGQYRKAFRLIVRFTVTVSFSKSLNRELCKEQFGCQPEKSLRSRAQRLRLGFLRKLRTAVLVSLRIGRSGPAPTVEPNVAVYLGKEVAYQKAEIRRALSKSTHEPGKPLRAIADQYPDPIALLGQPNLLGALNAIEKLEFNVAFGEL